MRKNGVEWFQWLRVLEESTRYVMYRIVMKIRSKRMAHAPLSRSHGIHAGKSSPQFIMI